MTVQRFIPAVLALGLGFVLGQGWERRAEEVRRHEAFMESCIRPGKTVFGSPHHCEMLYMRGGGR